jgi:hypothetical protein
VTSFNSGKQSQTLAIRFSLVVLYLNRIRTRTLFVAARRKRASRLRRTPARPVKRPNGFGRDAGRVDFVVCASSLAETIGVAD